jgi:integrase/recombinase XerD
MLHAALRHLLHVKQGRSSGTEPPSGLTPLDAVIHAFDLHMRDVRGLAPSTRLYRVRYVREFLQSVFGRGPLRLDRLVVADPMGFITAYARRCSPATAQVAASALRSFLRFLQLQGLCEARLVAAIPSIPHWDLAGIPRTLTEQQVKQLLASFDRATATGRRDYAMALCMVDLGLRVSDVVRLRLQDIDWRQSTVTVSGVKPRRCNVLPLPQRIGKAIADYVRRGRPRSQHVEVFLGHRAPVGAATRETLVRGVMNRAYARCGLDPRCRGTHVLRHTAASRMLQRGATLKQIADILGHRSIDTSAIYAKVNCPMLASVAMPWPEVKP